MSKKVRITWVKSGIGYMERHRRVIKALGLRRLNHTIEKELNPSVQGMIDTVSYMLHVEEV